MEKKTKKQIYLVVGVLIILAQVIQKLVPGITPELANSAEEAGYLFGYILILVVGIILTYKGLKKD